MSSIRHVLVATDCSAASTYAMRMAADLASRLGAKLSVVYVIPPSPYPYPIPASEEMREYGRDMLEGAIQSLGSEASAILRDGDPAAEIVAAAGEVNADLLVIGSRGRRGAARALLGSVAEKVVRLSPVPVLTAHTWRFEDRVDAGRSLAAALLPFQDDAPGLIATSPGAVVLAAEVGASLDEPVDLLLGTPVRHEDVLLGAICEEGTLRMDPSEAARSVSPFDRDVAFLKARAQLRDESTALQGGKSFGDLYQRTMVVVADALEEPWSVLVVCDVLRRLRASRVIVAAPAASSSTCAILARVVDDLIVLHTTDYADAGSIYRDERRVSVDEAAKRLHEQRSGHHDGARLAVAAATPKNERTSAARARASLRPRSMSRRANSPSNKR